MRHVTLVAIETGRRRLRAARIRWHMSRVAHAGRVELVMKRRWFVLASLLSLILLPSFPGEANAGGPGATPLSLSISSPSKREGTNKNVIMTFKVSLSARPTSVVTVDYYSIELSATSGVDYLPVNSTLTFQPGQRSQNIDVTILADDRVESNEIFVVGLTNAQGAEIANPQGIGTIIDDDR
jgi:hypothetical protein